MSDDDKLKHKRPLSHTIGKCIITGAMVATPIVWGNKFTNGFSTIPTKLKGDTELFPKDSAGRSELTKQFQLNFDPVIAGYSARDGRINYSKAELEFGANELKKYDVIEKSRNIDGFFGALMRDRESGRMMLYFAGMNVSPNLLKSAPDLWSALMSSTGSDNLQSDDAAKFARHCDELCRKKYGTYISVVAGHSLGAALAMGVAAEGILGPDTRYFLYDGPGANSNTLRVFAQRSGLSEEEVKKNLNEQCYSFTFTPNTYNLCGGQPGIAGTVSNKKNEARIYPMEHIYDDEFVKKLGELKTVIPRDDSQQSPAPIWIISICLTLAAAPWVAKPAMRAIVNPLAKRTSDGIDNVFKQLQQAEQDKKPETPKRA